MTQIYPTFVTSVEGIKEYRLKNGLQILLIPDASQSNFVLNIVYKVGSRHEGYGEKGMAHLLEHMLFKSTENLGDIKKLLSEKGGQANGTTWFDRTNYYEILPASDENLEWCIRMEADRMVNATILQSDLDVEFSVVRNEFEIGENNPGRILSERVLSAAYLWHNYGNSTIGSREDIERVKASRLKEFYKKYYQPDNAVLIIAGKYDEVKALEYADRYFSVIPAPERILDATYTVEPAQDGERFVELRKAGDIQMIAVAYHTAAYADQDFAAIDALNEILTSDPSGYLFKALVDQGKATNVYGWQPTLRDPAFLYLNVIIPKDKDLEDARRTLFLELDQVGEMEFTETDLNRAKSKLLTHFENVKNNTINLAIALTESIGAGDYRLAFLYRDAVEALTLEDLRRVATKYFIQSNRTVGVFIPENNVRRIQPKEISDQDIRALIENYVGKKEEEETIGFESTISNIRKNLSVITLPNGMRTGLLHKKMKGGKVLATFRFPTGTLDSLTGKNEIKSVMASLLTSGTSTKSKEEIHDRLDLLQSQISFGFSGQIFSLSVSSYEMHFESVMNLLKDMLTDSIFPEQEFLKVIKEKQAKTESSQNDPQTVVFSQIGRITNDYPEGHIFYAATPEEKITAFKQIRLDEVKNLYRTLGSDHGYGTVMSGLKKEHVERILKNTFENWTSESPYQKVLPSYFETKSSAEKINTPDKENGAVLARINLDINRYHPDYPALVMADALLGSGGFLTSRIPSRLREKEGISYGAGSFLNAAYDHPAAHWNIYAFYNPELMEQVDAAIKDEVAKILDQGFTREELEVNKKSWSTDRKTILGNNNFLVGTLINTYLDPGVALEEFDDLEAKIQALDVDKVNTAFRKYFDPEKLVFLYAGDFEKSAK